ncbi:hypothetical protein BDV95DRAFT_252156 [Massariosphaeria phaeospora]|uniref:NB-ARC domain-containing protein n=1 Tax=Massariosphaeria phaeospora TaxID=100035 RepID=A0A7C8HYZ4_9PLEO|nr:hypothetical protein BDV95DRAFT_252156 [Massariosphaeria phaeospora]
MHRAQEAYRSVGPSQVKVSHFMGRAQAFHDIQLKIDEAHRTSNGTAVTILGGIGGRGKSQIALRYCQDSDSLGRYHGIFWVDASSARSITQSFEKIAHLLSSNDKAQLGRQLTKERIGDELQRWTERWLLVFDHYEGQSAFDINAYIPQSRSLSLSSNPTVHYQDDELPSALSSSRHRVRDSRTTGGTASTSPT